MNLVLTFGVGCDCKHYALQMHAVLHASVATHDMFSISDIEYEELLEKLKNDQVKLIDVRMKDEIAELGCAAGSLSLPLPYLGDYLVLEPEHFLMTLGFPKPSEKDTIVTMCKAGSRARTAQLAFMGARYTNVRTYKGSFQDWTEKGGPMKQTQ
ncbi:rhodanese domain-containing protein CG4456-like isoform X3 [Oratosquilla oratoria]|uniref:rhodanese domain-containing protein CG4456-like isoform X3 n=1 Tax=Oratosquilla oratoria TaxID=337810 RepID=UPI003F76CB09